MQSYDFDDSLNRDFVEDGKGNETRYERDSLGRTWVITDALGQATTFTYQGQTTNLTSTTDARGHTTGYVYDSQNNLLSTTNALSGTTGYTYNSRGQVSTVTDENGNVTSYSYDPITRDRTGMTNALNQTTTYEYDSLGRLVSTTDPLGRETVYSYDALNRVETITNPLLGVTGYSYDPAGNRLSVTDAENRTTGYAYDALNRVITTTNPSTSSGQAGGQSSVAYDAAGNRLSATDANGRTTTFGYDSLSRLVQTTDAENQTTSTSYDALGNRLTSTDAENNITSYSYDALNRLVQTTNALNGVTSLSYDGLGNRLSVTNAENKTTSYSYDALGRLVQTTDPNNLTTSVSYDGLGNRLSVTNGANETTAFEYDQANRLVLTRDPLNNETQYRYDGAGNRTALIDAEGIETRYAYDDLGRLTGVTENYVDGVYSAGVTDQDVITQYQYDAVGNRLTVTDARSHETTYQYDALNRRLSMIDALNHSTAYGYDAVGNRTVITDANGTVTTFGYDNVYRLTGIDYSDSTPDVTFTYDHAGNRLTMSDGTGTTGYSYDDLYRLTGVTDGAGLTVGYAYDAVGNRTGLTYPDSKQVTYNYDAGNRLETVTADWLTGQFGYNYDEANRLTGLDLPNGVSSSYSYDEAGRLDLLTHDTVTATLAGYAYTLDDVGNRRTLTEEILTVETLPAGSYQESGGLVVLEAEHGQRSNGLTHTWLLKTSQPGYTGTSYLASSLDIDALVQTSEITASPRAEYLVNVTTPGTYTVWLRGYPSNAAGDSIYVELSEWNEFGELGELTTVSGFTPGDWSWASQAIDSSTNQLVITQTGLYTVSLWLREDGLRLDRFLLTTDETFTPTGFGPAESERLTEAEVNPTLLTHTIVYTYDNLYRLTEADYSTGDSYAYDYDPVGNRLQQIINGDTTDYLYDAANRLEQLNGQAVYTFDANGNLLSSDTLTNTWDAANRLTATERDGVEILSDYNGVGDRVVRYRFEGPASEAIPLVLDVAAGLPEVVQAGTSRYLHLPGVIVAQNDTTTRFLLSDGLGSIRQATDETGQVVSYHAFDPYGNPLAGGGDPYGYTGEWWEEDLGLLHLRARWYAPEDGVFLSRDAVESEPPYLYARGNPVNWTDSSGNSPECDPDKPCQVLSGANKLDRIGAGLNEYGLLDYAPYHNYILVVDPNNSYRAGFPSPEPFMGNIPGFANIGNNDTVYYFGAFSQEAIGEPVTGPFFLGYMVTRYGLYDSTAPDFVTSNKPHLRPEYQLRDDNVSCNDILQCLKNTALRIQAAQIDYDTFFANSNWFTKTMLRGCGIEAGSPTNGVLSPGWYYEGVPEYDWNPDLPLPTPAPSPPVTSTPQPF